VRAVAQRVREATVTVGGEVVGTIGAGLLVYLGAASDDDADDVEYTAQKLVGLRIFPDDEGKMSRSLADTGGSMLVVSQFTLFGDVRRGRRPSFDGAAAPERANELYERLCARVRELGVRAETGRFRATMHVSSVGDGPVTILVDSKKLF
jgi:D-aminoacyl-tRNA deacylase